MAKVQLGILERVNKTVDEEMERLSKRVTEPTGASRSLSPMLFKSQFGMINLLEISNIQKRN
jgi:hypothetical protein